MLRLYDGFKRYTVNKRPLAAKMVLSAGIEPALGYPKQILSLQRLPIPPREHGATLAGDF